MFPSPSTSGYSPNITKKMLSIIFHSTLYQPCLKVSSQLPFFLDIQGFFAHIGFQTNVLRIRKERGNPHVFITNPIFPRSVLPCGHRKIYKVPKHRFLFLAADSKNCLFHAEQAVSLMSEIDRTAASSARLSSGSDDRRR